MKRRITIMKASIELADGPKCGPASGSVNYPNVAEATGTMVMTQYTFAATICGASPVAADIMVDATHPLAKFKPTKMIWAAFASDLSFSGSPLIAIELADK